MVGCANGTDALEIMLDALGVGPGDEVLGASNDLDFHGRGGGNTWRKASVH